jgi:transcriptional antiterminator NusG
VEKDMTKHWYVVHTYSGYENKVQQNLEHKIKSLGMEDRIFKVSVPTEEVMEMKGGEKKISKRKIFPGYVLIEMEMGNDAWYIIKSIPGVTNFVGSGGRPIPLTDTEVDNIKKQVVAVKEKPRPKVAFERGESVKVIDGPFTNFTGKVEEVNPSKGKLKVSISVFGRATPVELDFLQVGKL